MFGSIRLYWWPQNLAQRQINKTPTRLGWMKEYEILGYVHW
jgi:hypothetical protein